MRHLLMAGYDQVAAIPAGEVAYNAGLNIYRRLHALHYNKESGGRGKVVYLPPRHHDTKAL